MKISKISLKNTSPFVTRIHVLAKSILSDETQEFHDPQDILQGATHVVDLGTLGVTSGYEVTLKAQVVWGKDNTAGQSFIYKEGAQTAFYAISGVTLDNQLGFIDVK